MNHAVHLWGETQRDVYNTHMIKNPRLFQQCLFLLGALSLTACSSLITSITPYRIDVLQGNFVSKEQAAQLKPGMPQEAVRNVLGTPLLQDPFHADRWDYVFSLKPGNRPTELKRLTVYFDKEGKLLRTEGDALPSEEEFVVRLDDLRRGVARAGDEPKKVAEVTPAAAPAVATAAVPAAPMIAAVPTAPIAPIAPIATITPIAPAPAPAVVADATPAAPAATATATAAPAQKEMVAQELAKIEKEVVQMLESWRNAWAGKQVAPYLAYYTPEYKGEYTNRSAWETARRTRLTSPKTITLDLTEARILITAPDKARVGMQQRYRADGLDESGAKSLYLVKRDGKWLIENELFFSKPQQ
jgi:outer membrane protein assembly factor BamE